MDDRRRDLDRNAELEELLAEGLSAPPESVLAQVTPWRRGVSRLLWGLALCTVTLQFWNLHYILPSAGLVLILLGLRPLRKENGFFFLFWGTHLLRMGMWAFLLLYQAVPGWEALFQSSFGSAFTAASTGLQLVQFFCLWQGFRATRRRAGLDPGAGSGLALLIFYCLILCLGLSGLTQIGWFFFAVMFAVYICIFRGLFQLSRELDEAGYGIRPAPVRIPDLPLALGLTGAVLAGIVIIGLTCSRLPMDWQPVDPSEHSGLAEAEAHLLELGFPEEVLADLTRSDILSCGGALRVEVNRERHSLTMSRNDGAPKPLAMTHVAVELPGERESWRIFHHFAWDSGTELYGSEAFQLWTIYDHTSEGWRRLADPSGRLLCDRDGTACWSPYHSLGVETYTSDSMFFGAQTFSDPMAAFSFPRQGENCRGYVTYAAEEVRDGWILDSWINYVHQQRRFVYPAQTAREWQMSGAWSGEGQPFFRIQTAIQFYPFDW